MKRELALLSLGVLIGALGSVSVRSVFTPAGAGVAPASAALADSDEPLPPPAPWSLPRLLPPAEADARIEGWLGEASLDLAALRRLLPMLPREKFSSLAETLLARRGADAREAFQAVFDVWVERDPATAAHWAGDLPESVPLNGRARRLLREQAGLAWARDDLAGALAWAHSLPDAAGEWGAAARIYGQLAERDPQGALQLVRALGDQAFFAKAARRIYDGWATRDPAAALQGLGDTLLGDGLNLVHLSNDIGRWITQDPDAALRWVLERDRADATWTSSLFASLSKRADASALVPALLRVTREAPPVDLFAAPLQTWIKSDPAATKAWLAGLDADLRNKLLLRAGGSHTVGRPWENLDLARMLPAGVERDRIIAARVDAWFDLDPEAALAWLKANDEPAASATVQAKLIGRLAQTDRAAALARLAQVSPGQEKRSATRAVAAAWANSSPSEAAEWLAAATRSPSESYNHQDWGAVVGPWFQKDPAQVRDWVDAQPDAALRGEAGTAWILQVLNSPLSHAERAELVAGVKEEARQRQDMLNVAAHWFGVDEAGARAWIGSSTLPEETKRIVIEAYGKKAPTR
jgi:hypothetical protein